MSILALAGTVPVLINSFKALTKKEITVDHLASVALMFSFFTKEWHSAVFINLMLASARIFDRWTEKRKDSIINSLLKYRPTQIKVLVDGDIVTKSIEAVKVGDIISVEEGVRVPVDGALTEGQGSVDESTLTGESIPVTKKKGDKVYSSTLNTSGSFYMKAEKLASESTLAKIIIMIEESSLKKSKTVKIVSKFTKWYVLLTFLGSGILYLFTGNVEIVLAVLLVVCADDIAVSVPLAFTVATAKAAQRGILVKSSDVLERISKIRTFVTDKTGTLTFGKPKVEDVISLGKFNLKRLFGYLGTVEINSNHPVSKSIILFLESKKIKIQKPDSFREDPGEGIVAKIDSKEIVAGKVEFLERNDVHISKEFKETFIELNQRGLSLTLIGLDKKLIGYLTFVDQVRPSARRLIEETKRLGVKSWVMLTGDNQIMARRVADEVGVSDYRVGLKADEKIKEIENIKKTSDGLVAMMGDGVNDAASLAMADVSFAMGVAGSDAAINAADVALMTDNLEKIPEAMKLGNKTNEIVTQNFVIWAATNLIGLGLVFAGVLSPTGAATYNFLTDFVPIFNSLRLGMKRIN
jgi:heavy metal translocating P-type ATPase